MRLLRQMIADQSGATAIEYGLIAAIMSVALISGFGVLSGRVQNVFETVTATITAAWT
ncbi:Flp family type IVb pilin [Rhizobium wuzhouense]|uniref:Flp family type IVb pilin n=1 Tax=Rhizobium wuzhouense TaxID=1986026 RepID=A0ABX5NRD9_9HYPH|nr:Flp family type IVb pilin [Rhizobium wuzhouense]PYB73909.1 Flp family type IVb pilin [Rhizobium wuzhouense]